MERRISVELSGPPPEVIPIIPVRKNRKRTFPFEL